MWETAGDDFSNEMNSKAGSSYQTDEVGLVFETLSGVVTAANENATKLVLKELKEILSDKQIDANMNVIFPYLYATGFLAFVGREINKENISKVLEAVGMSPDTNAEKLLLSTHVRNNIIYLYTLYFLMVMGSEVNEKNMFRVLSAIDEPVNDAAAEDVLVLYNKKIIP